ncbi:dTDP-4-dehydrorhamnose reductase [Gammaproteobacteria bacterium]|nr:dTDP-4-dehydrorhamnose reductase [Gammaproteobacteria bacterium]
MILILGSNGQLGSDLQRVLSEKKIKFKSFTRRDLNIEDLAELEKKLTEENFEYLVNCTSYHKVDEVEKNAEKAFLVNSNALEVMSKVCLKKKSTLFHISTDYVFGGNEESKPLSEKATTAPLNVYGFSKVEGENFIITSGCSYYIFRVASLFGISGASGKGGNFVEAIYKKALNEGSISVVDDQIMSPTSTSFIAKVISEFTSNDYESGIYNVVNDGQVSWFDFAKKICEFCSIDVKATAIKADSLNLCAKRPSYSVLDNSKIKELGVEVKNYEDELLEYLTMKGYIN